MNKLVETNKLLKSSTGNIQEINQCKKKLRNSSNPKETTTKMGKAVKFIDDKIIHDKNNSRTHKKKSNLNDNMRQSHFK